MTAQSDKRTNIAYTYTSSTLPTFLTHIYYNTQPASKIKSFVDYVLNTFWFRYKTLNKQI